jgi:ribose transport system ATP-binding protein
MSEVLLEMKGVTKQFPGVRALDGVDFQIKRGEVVALVGENGAGKSTLMKLLGGIHQPDSGTIIFAGKEVSIDSVATSVELGIGFVHQELSNVDQLDVASNIFLGREPVWAGPLKLIDKRKIHSLAREYLAPLSPEISTRDRIGSLSLAKQQLVEIARALSLNARLLILDEPTSTLTAAETEKLMAVINDLKSKNVSIIYISHRLSEVSTIADRAFVLRDGKNAGTLEREELNHDTLISLMMGRELESASKPSEPHKTSITRFEARDLRTQRYPNKKISFDVHMGEIVGIAGLVGSGRSELAETIFGANPSRGGRLFLDGKLIEIKSPRDAIRNGIYLIPEDRRRAGLILQMSVKENITVSSLKSFSKLGIVKQSAETEAVEELCADLRIKAPSIRAKAGNLSGGNQQKVVIAKWLLSARPKLLIFDEPTRGIDVGAKAEIYNTMRSLATKGVSILMISSDMEEILSLSDRIIVMREGSITGEVAKENFSEQSVMNLAF